jgi:hypothetical protein
LQNQARDEGQRGRAPDRSQRLPGLPEKVQRDPQPLAWRRELGEYILGRAIADITKSTISGDYRDQPDHRQKDGPRAATEETGEAPPLSPPARGWGTLWWKEEG